MQHFGRTLVTASSDVGRQSKMGISQETYQRIKISQGFRGIEHVTNKVGKF